MAYRIFNISTSKECDPIEIQNCKITGNNSMYELKDGKIYKYSIMGGDVNLESKQEVSRIELTNYQISLFNNVKCKDGKFNVLDENDLKFLNDTKLTQIMEEVYEDDNIYKIVKAKVTELSVQLNLLVNGDKNNNVKNISIEFEKGPNFFQRLALWVKNREVIGTNDVEEDVRENTNTLDDYNVGDHKENEALRNDLETKNEMNSTTKSDKNSQNTQNANNSNNVTISKFSSLNDALIKAEATVYTVQRGDSIDGISRKFGFSHNRILLNANPNINPNNLQIGAKINIPARYSVEKLKITSAEDIEKYVGVSAEYIDDVLTVSEGFLAKPYKDDAGYAKKDKSKAPYAIGFGHGRSLPREYFSSDLPEKYKSMQKVPLNSETANYVTITEAQAYKILAQDLVNAKMEAEAYLGEAFSNAPQSIQDAIVDIVYNKGVSKGLMGKNDDGSDKDTPSKYIKKFLDEGDYGMVAACIEYRTSLDGLNIRNVRRFKHAIRDLDRRQKNVAVDNFAYLSIKNKLTRQATKDEVSDIWRSI